MTTQITPDRVLILDGSDVVMDTDQDLLHLIGDRKDGVVTRSALDWGPSDNPDTRSFNGVVASGLPSASTHIAGLVRFQFSTGASYLPSGSWFVAGGSFLLEHKRFQSLSGTWGNYPSSIAVATFYKSGTTIRFKEDIVLADTFIAGPGDSLAGYTATFRLWPAIFT